ncbi:unnamed protein product [Lymnaea stagnalis]|uniref:Phytanoyl-CoA dioxygenase n=1 Tax=Lymnaea stagnalis TaxID=6523 RepID=A0AAV2HGX3_LYMST
MLTAKNRDDLEIKGYTIIENAVPDHAQLRDEFFDWMSHHFKNGSAPYSVHSIVRHYGIGYLEPAWAVRLQVKKYFTQLWGTEQLLTSVDAVAIGQPPELGVEEFDNDSNHWLHVDQCAARLGLHAYQGAVYLETAEEEDWTFEVLEGSHQHLETFYGRNDKAKIRSVNTGLWRMRDEDIRWYESLGCSRRRVPARAGDLLLWDSRLVHANARPKQGRQHHDRWRLVVLVCMGPAAFSTKEDMAKKRRAYKEMLMTAHWPSDDVGIMENYLPSYATQPEPKHSVTLPEVAKSTEVKQLVGATPYKVSPKSKVPAGRPKWDPTLRPDMAKRTAKMYSGENCGAQLKSLLLLLTALIVMCLCWNSLH